MGTGIRPVRLRFLDTRPGWDAAALQGSLICGPQAWLVLSPQDNQTDSGMVLASEEFEEIESRHRQEGSFSCKGPGQHMDIPRGHHDPQGRRRRPTQGAQGGKVFYNNEYGEVSQPCTEGDCCPSAVSTFFADSSY